jgi:hypothetical protein
MYFACQEEREEFFRPRGPDFLQLSLQQGSRQSGMGISAQETTGIT